MKIAIVREHQPDNRIDLAAQAVGVVTAQAVGAVTAQAIGAVTVLSVDPPCKTRHTTHNTAHQTPSVYC